jgi:two-component system OmpR family response regulator
MSRPLHTEAPLRVLLVEDSKMLAERLRETLNQLEGVEVIETVADERSAIDFARRGSVDLMVLDLQLRQGTGFGVLQALGAERPAVIVLTNFSVPEYQRRAESMGVEYFLNKSRDCERLPEVIRAIQQRYN